MQVCVGLVCVSQKRCLYHFCVFLYGWGDSLVCPQCVCSVKHGMSACMPPIRLEEVAVVGGLSVFHVLHTSLLPPNNTLRGIKKKKNNTRLTLCFFFFFFRFLQCLLLKLYLFIFSGVCLCPLRGFPIPRVVFLVSKDRFVLCCLICVSGKKKKKKESTGEMECEVREGGREKERKREEGREKEKRRREREKGGWAERLGLKRHTRLARSQSWVSVRRAPRPPGQSVFT